MAAKFSVTRVEYESNIWTRLGKRVWGVKKLLLVEFGLKSTYVTLAVGSQKWFSGRICNSQIQLLPSIFQVVFSLVASWRYYHLQYIMQLFTTTGI